MATFNIPTNDQAELAGSVTELIGRLVAVRPLSRTTVTVGTEYGSRAALRVRLVDLSDSSDAGVRLLFWESAQRQVLEATETADWAVGTFVQQAQVKDPTRSVYLFTPPDMSEIDPTAISTAIDTAIAPF